MARYPRVAALALLALVACGTSNSTQGENATDGGQTGGDAGGSSSGSSGSSSGGSGSGSGSSGSGGGLDASGSSDGATHDASPAVDGGPADAGAPAEAGSGDGGKGAVCLTNAGCSSGLVCFSDAPVMCGTGLGRCVAELSTLCSQEIGGGCPCLDVPSGTCTNSGAYCKGTNDPSQCWICQLPQ